MDVGRIRPGTSADRISRKRTRFAADRIDAITSPASAVAHSLTWPVAARLVLDRIGRRRLLIPGSVVAAGALVVLGCFFLSRVAGIGKSDEERSVGEARGEVT